MHPGQLTDKKQERRKGEREEREKAGGRLRAGSRLLLHLSDINGMPTVSQALKYKRFFFAWGSLGFLYLARGSHQI